jgi:hypothetical protein
LALELSLQSSDDTNDDTRAAPPSHNSNVGRRRQTKQITAATASNDNIILKHLDNRLVRFGEEIRNDLAKTRDTTVTAARARALDRSFEDL